ncbi:hypothetical protein T492DRAFT_1009088 [Pavlovales sp. CCMP2436]|nr:hypothetical protein T492DRAFT_1009088 [Pavlovales sp. CCMP2436]|mmetsp:Transcript_38867/g.91259  ORF Transcript_38867/g.91259 Transcript_38867/m.91259 type:complete len:174 (+) Transcript_38867:118-639(+)
MAAPSQLAQARASGREEVPLVALQEFLAAIQAGDFDAAIAIGEAILRAEPSNELVRRAMPSLCLRRDQLAVLQTLGAGDDGEDDDEVDDEGDEGDGAGAPAGAEDEEGEEDDDADDDDDDDDDNDDGDSGADESASEVTEQVRCMKLDELEVALSATRDQPIKSLLKKLLTNE